jgi:hypothetical protein
MCFAKLPAWIFRPKSLTDSFSFVRDTRNTFIAVIPTRYLYERLKDALTNHSLEAAARLYSMFLRNPKTRTPAAYMLDDAIRDLFYKGGEWPIVRLTANHPGPKFTHWKTPSAKTNPEYLRIGYQGQPSLLHLISYLTT